MIWAGFTTRTEDRRALPVNAGNRLPDRGRPSRAILQGSGLAGAPTRPSWPGAVCSVQGKPKSHRPVSSAGCELPATRAASKERGSGSEPAGSAQSAMVAGSGAETTYELIDPLSADHSQIPKTPFDLVAATAIVHAVAA